VLLLSDILCEDKVKDLLGPQYKGLSPLILDILYGGAMPVVDFPAVCSDDESFRDLKLTAFLLSYYKMQFTVSQKFASYTSFIQESVIESFFFIQGIEPTNFSYHLAQESAGYSMDSNYSNGCSLKDTPFYFLLHMTLRYKYFDRLLSKGIICNADDILGCFTETLVKEVPLFLDNYYFKFMFLVSCLWESTPNISVSNYHKIRVEVAQFKDKCSSLISASSFPIKCWKDPNFIVTFADGHFLNLKTLSSDILSVAYSRLNSYNHVRCFDYQDYKTFFMINRAYNDNHGGMNLKMPMPRDMSSPLQFLVFKDYGFENCDQVLSMIENFSMSLTPSQAIDDLVGDD
jgi:hypothetical protein